MTTLGGGSTAPGPAGSGGSGSGHLSGSGGDEPPSGSGRSDRDLLRAHVDGDRDAFAELFHRHRDRLWAVAIRTVNDREEAADALQDALLSAHRAAARFRGDSAVTTWLHRIVVNACLDRIRRRQAHPTVPLPDGRRPDDTADRWSSAPEPVAAAVDHDTALVVRQALARLPDEQRIALVLVDVQGYPVAEVAAMLGVAEGTVKSRCARSRAKLAAVLADLRPARTPAPRQLAPRIEPADAAVPAERVAPAVPAERVAPAESASSSAAAPRPPVPSVTGGNPTAGGSVTSDDQSCPADDPEHRPAGRGAGVVAGRSGDPASGGRERGGSVHGRGEER